MFRFSLFLFVFSSQLFAGASHLTVGDESDDACDFHSIQSAINSGMSNNIRIASNKNYFESLTSTDRPLHLIGGYADCSMADFNITDLSQAIITGNGTDRVIQFINSSAGNYDLTVRNLIVANGSDGIYVTSQNSADTTITINNIRSFNNDDAGIQLVSVSGGMTEAIVNDSQIDFNMKSGIDCSGSNQNLKVTGNTVISDNQSITGGGISIFNSCNLELYSPTEIKNNSATSGGGGLRVNNATAQIYGMATGCNNGICFGEWESPVLIQNNDGNSNDDVLGSGGGVYVSGASSSVVIFNTLIQDNQARRGGGVSIDTDATVSLVGFNNPTDSCWSPGKCMQMLNNHAGTGGAVSSASDSALTVSRSWISKNSSDSGVVGTATSGGRLIFESTVVSDNGYLGLGSSGYSDNSLFQIDNSSVLTLGYLTVADNNVIQRVINNENGSASIFSSIILGDVEVYQESGNSPSSQFECVIAHENSSFSAGGTVSVIDPNMVPLFVNPNAGNYHLLVDSMAIDYCYNAYNDTSSDIDNDSRGIDKVDVADLHGIYDIGADEFHINNDIIFEDDLED